MNTSALPADAGFRELARQALDRSQTAYDQIAAAHARQDTHEALDELKHNQMHDDVGLLRGEIHGVQDQIRHATWGLIVGMATLIGTIIAKGHLF
jgi:hypothetical protein